MSTLVRPSDSVYSPRFCVIVRSRARNSRRSFEDAPVMTIYRFLVVIEKANGNYSAYSPDLPGCVATGKTRNQVTCNMHEAIEMHVRGLLEDKLPVPQSHSFAEYVAIPA